MSGAVEIGAYIVFVVICGMLGMLILGPVGKGILGLFLGLLLGPLGLIFALIIRSNTVNAIALQQTQARSTRRSRPRSPARSVASKNSEEQELAAMGVLLPKPKAAEDEPRKKTREESLAQLLREERECPFCAELILAKAKVCKHCGRDLPTENETE